MLFDGWDNILRVAVVGGLGYAGLVAILRISGNRTLSKMNAFDLVVTVAFGSTLSALFVDAKVSLAAGLAALAMLVLLQLVITWCSVRSGLVRRAVKATPKVLVRRGELLTAELKRARVTQDEVLCAVRQHGYGSLGDIDAVVLETDGSMSVIAADQAGDRSAYAGLPPPGGA